MSFCHRSLLSLEFDKIREMLALHATTEGAKGMAMTISPTDDIDNVLKRLKKTTDAKGFAKIRVCHRFRACATYQRRATEQERARRSIPESCLT